MNKFATILILSLGVAAMQAEEKPVRKFKSVHGVMTIENKTENVIVQESETELWMKGENQRSETAFKGAKSVAITRGSLQYTYQLGGKVGGIHHLTEEDDNNISELVGMWKLGNKAGSGVAEGIACDKFQLFVEDTTITIWISQQFDFPVKAVMAQDDGMTKSTKTALFKNLVFDQDLPDSLFEPPKNVKFKDAQPSK